MRSRSKAGVSTTLAVIIILGVASSGIVGILTYEDLQLQSTLSSDSSQISTLNSNVANLQTQNSKLQSENSNLDSQVASLQAENSNLQTQNSKLQSENSNLDSQVASLQAENSNLQSEISNIQRSPDIVYSCGNSGGCTLTIWTVSASLSSSGYLFESVPDTFDYYDVWTSTSPVIVYYLSNSQYVQFANCGGSISCVSGTYYYDGPTTSANYEFTLAEGCGGYVAIYQLYSGTSGTIYPDIFVTYNPASSPTGVCA